MNRKRRVSLKADASGKFYFPIGIELDEGENYRQIEGYEANYLADEEFPRYQYIAVVSVERAAGLFEKLAGLLPDWVSAIVEAPAPEKRGQDYCDIWTSPPIPRSKVLDIFRQHAFLFCHDGMVGFGAAGPEEGGDELFLDDHKILYYYTPGIGKVEPVFASEGLIGTKRLRHFTDLSHVHYNLSRRNQGEDYLAMIEDLHLQIGLEWQDTREY